MKKVIGILLSLIMIVVLAYGVLHPDSVVMTLIVCLVWTFVQVGTVYSVAGMILLYMAERLPVLQRGETLAEMRTLFCSRNAYSAGKYHIWCEAAIIVVCLTMTGYILTTLSFLLVAAIMAYTCNTISQSASKWTAC